MKKKRPDGYYIKNINPYQKLVPHIMPKRYDAQNWCKVEVRCENIDKFIAEQAKLGKNYNYMDIMLTTIVRLLARRPCLNRFCKNKRIYQHNDITISFTVKKILKDDSEDTTVKLHFTGEESLDEVKAAVDKIIAENTGEKAYNSVDKTAKFLTSAPHWLISMFVGILNWLDNRNILPGSIIEVSPFHNSIFITFMKSIKGDYLYHHCYEFGTTSIFVGMGKEKVQPVVECGELKVGRVMTLGIVCDERFCDGLYYVNSMRIMKNMLLTPSQLLERYDLDSEVKAINGIRSAEDEERFRELAKERERKKKEAKKAAKAAARAEKKNKK